MELKRPTTDVNTAVQEELLDVLQKDGFKYFIDKVNPHNGLIADSTWDNDTSSIAAVGFALACYPVGVEHGWVSRQDAVERTLITLRHFLSSPQGTEGGAAGYQGFYYHFWIYRPGSEPGKASCRQLIQPTCSAVC